MALPVYQGPRLGSKKRRDTRDSRSQGSLPLVTPPGANPRPTVGQTRTTLCQEIPNPGWPEGALQQMVRIKRSISGLPQHSFGWTTGSVYPCTEQSSSRGEILSPRGHVSHSYLDWLSSLGFLPVSDSGGPKGVTQAAPQSTQRSRLYWEEPH